MVLNWQFVYFVNLVLPQRMNVNVLSPQCYMYQFPSYSSTVHTMCQYSKLLPQ